MSVFLSRTHLNRFIIIRNSNFLQSPETVLTSLRWISSISTSVDSNSNSFVVSYLINSCGLSPEFALLASKHVNFKTSKKPDVVLSLLHDHLGLSKPQVSKVVKSYPRILLCNPHESIFPKLDFFRTKGASIPQITKLVVNYPWFLHRSLQNFIIPNFNFLRCFHQSDQDVVTSLVREPFTLSTNVATNMTPKINFLRDNGLGETAIAMIMKYSTKRFSFMNLVKFKKLVKEVREMGIDTSRGCTFAKALVVVKGLSKSTWKRKVDVFKSWDLSEEEVLVAFRKEPSIMLRSEKKIMAAMDLLVNKLGWEPSIISKYPILLDLSLERRLIPRALVLQFLLSKCLIKNDFRNGNFFIVPDTRFMKRYVNRYNEAPEILKVYRGQRLDLHQFEKETTLTEMIPTKTPANVTS